MSTSPQTVMQDNHAPTVLALSQLLEIENDEALLQPTCSVTGMPVWTLVRNQFVRLIISDLLYGSQSLVSSAAGMQRIRIAQASLRSIVYNLTHRPKHSQMLIRATGAGLIERDGRCFNRYTDYFASAAESGAWSLEDLASGAWPTLPRAGRVGYTTAAFAAIHLRARLGIASLHRELAQKTVDIAASRAERLLDWRLEGARYDWLVQLGARRLAALPLQREYMATWLRRVQPSLFLVEEGCYGHMAIFNATAREHGVRVAEFQHGAVTAGHDVYNVAPFLAESASYRRGLPDFFLGYGNWWHSQFNLPIDKIVIGNPHREAILQAESSRTVATSKRTVLILGDGIELKPHLLLCSQLSALLPSGWEVLFRPHPLERRQVLAMDASAFAGFSLDRQSDIYTSLAQSEAVVAELSTGLFDGVGLARRIFVWDTAKSRFSLPSHPFARIADALSLARALQAPLEGGLSVEECESIWASGWRERFRAFLRAN